MMSLLLLASVFGIASVSALPQGSPASSTSAAPTPSYAGEIAGTTTSGGVQLPSPTCVQGSPVKDSDWDIEYALATPAADITDLGAGFRVFPEWFSAHKIGSGVSDCMIRLARFCRRLWDGIAPLVVYVLGLCRCCCCYC
jgi:hypothetical protein